MDHFNRSLPALSLRPSFPLPAIILPLPHNFQLKHSFLLCSPLPLPQSLQLPTVPTFVSIIYAMHETRFQRAT